MLFRNIIFSVLKTVVADPRVQKKVANVSNELLQKSKPALLKGSRKAGKITANISNEIKSGIDKFKKEKNK